MFAKFTSHELGKFLLKARNEYAYGFSIGRLSIMWDTGKPAPPPVPTSDLLPDKGLYHD